MQTVFINGKFTLQPITGVQRVAWNLLCALDGSLTTGPMSCILLCPPDAPAMEFRHIEVRRVGWSGLPLHLWEQAVLPLEASKGLLLNLAGSAPFLGSSQVAVLHDAAVFDCPCGYTRQFVWWYRQLFRHLSRRAVHVLTVSTFSHTRLVANLGIGPGGLSVIDPGGDHLNDVYSDESALPKLGLTRGNYFLSVASRNPNKNLAGLISAYRAFCETGGSHKLVVVGDGNARVFARDSHSAPDPDGVVRTGRVDDHQLKALYQGATCLVVASFYEGFGLPALEAMSCGCPVAATDRAALPEVCGEAALYFDATSRVAITAALVRLATEPALRGALQLAGQQRAARHAWKDAGQHLKSLLSAHARLHCT